MNRRDFLATSASGALGATLDPRPGRHGVTGAVGEPQGGSIAVRDRFPRLAREIFLNAAGGTPLGDFAERGLRRYEDFWRMGPGDGRREYVDQMLAETRAGLGRLLGAAPEEIALVQSTKQGEQVVLDGLPALCEGGNVVTNDLHFAGSLHNLIGLQRAGLDVRIVSAEDWRTRVEAMTAAIDDRTALVSVTLLSNVNGHIEPIREIADAAHAHGAHVYADVIQAAGISPIDVTAMGIDFAAGNGYKWLYGPHGTGFLYVRDELQGTVLEDRAYPGHARHNYFPWTLSPDPGTPPFLVAPRSDAERYQLGHQSYLGYAAVHEGLKFIDEIRLDASLAHCVRLNARLLAGLDPDRYRCISPDLERSPIIAFMAPGVADLRSRLERGNVVVSLGGSGYLRVSPAVYNDESDVDALIAALT